MKLSFAAIESKLLTMEEKFFSKIEINVEIEEIVQKELKKDNIKCLQRLDEHRKIILKDIEKSATNFRSLLNQAYLEEYEKMRKNPPRPKRGPKIKVDPPSKYRFLDDDFVISNIEGK